MNTIRKNLLYIGLDTHKSFTVASVITEKGELIKQKKLVNFTKEWHDFFYNLSEKSRLTMAFEANSMMKKVYSELERYGTVKVAHPTKVRLITESRLKTDKKDSIALARLLRLQELPEVYTIKDDTLRLRNLTRERLRLKHNISKYKCQIRHLLLINGIILKGNIFTKERREQLKQLRIEEINRRLDFIEAIEQEIEAINERIKEIVYNHSNLDILTSIPGIALYTASLLTAEIADISRFTSFRKLASYSGMVPSQYQSGNKNYYGRLTRQGNKYIRWALVESANIAIRHDNKMKTFYDRIARKKGHNKAIVATAKKLLKIAYTLLKRNEVYRSTA